MQLKVIGSLSRLPPHDLGVPTLPGLKLGELADSPISVSENDNRPVPTLAAPAEGKDYLTDPSRAAKLGNETRRVCTPMRPSRIHHSIAARLESTELDVEADMIAHWNNSRKVWLDITPKARRGDIVVAVAGGYSPLPLRTDSTPGISSKAMRYRYLGPVLVSDRMQEILRGCMPSH